MWLNKAMESTDFNGELALGEWPFERFREAAEKMAVRDWNEPLPGCCDPPLFNALNRDDGAAEFVRWLLDHGADPNVRMDDGIAPIHYAVGGGEVEAVRLLLERGALVNQPNFDACPWRPIHAAMGCGDAELVRLLVRNGAFADCMNGYGDTPETMTEWLGGCEGFAEILKEGLPGPGGRWEKKPPTLYLLMGIQASGKTTFCRRVLGEEVAVVSLDVQRTRAKERAAFEAALSEGRAVAVDDTNATREQRAGWLAAAKAAGYRTAGIYFRSAVGECLKRNEAREGRAKVKRLAVLGIAAKMELPSAEEGFDRRFHARVSGAGLFEIEPWKEA